MPEATHFASRRGTNDTNTVWLAPDNNPDGVPIDVFDMVREQTAANRW